MSSTRLGRRGGKATHGNPAFESAARETKAYAARILGNPPACPMFPGVNRANGAAETLCYMQGYLAGRLEAAGKTPTRVQMAASRDDVMHDDAVREIVVGMQDSTLSVPGVTLPSARW